MATDVKKRSADTAKLDNTGAETTEKRPKTDTGTEWFEGSIAHRILTKVIGERVFIDQYKTCPLYPGETATMVVQRCDHKSILLEPNISKALQSDWIRFGIKVKERMVCNHLGIYKHVSPTDGKASWAVTVYIIRGDPDFVDWVVFDALVTLDDDTSNV